MASPDISGFRRRLDSFVFFHLGSDARMEFEESEGSVKVSLDHPRVHPFRFDLDSESVARMASDSLALEDFMLEKLTEHRRVSAR